MSARQAEFRRQRSSVVSPVCAGFHISWRRSLQQYWALGTNTFRVTENADAFIASAREIGIDISVISGVQEAVLIYAGVITDCRVVMFVVWLLISAVAAQKSLSAVNISDY